MHKIPNRGNICIFSRRDVPGEIPGIGGVNIWILNGKIKLATRKSFIPLRKNASSICKFPGRRVFFFLSLFTNIIISLAFLAFFLLLVCDTTR